MNICGSSIENIGWTIGNDCPYRCSQCYSHIVRNRGRNLEISDVDRIVSQLQKIGIKTVNLGGNEPIYTSGIDPRKTILPYIIRSLYEAKIAVGLTTAGITLVYLERLFPDTVPMLNDVDISLDSPFLDEHNKNRGAALFNLALKAIGICREYGIERTIIMCGMCWNLSDRHLTALIKLAHNHKALIRINFMKPTETQHMALVPDALQFYHACQVLITQCKVIEMAEPLISTLANEGSKGCPCGIKSFRIHSIDRTGRVQVSPCVYVHDYRTGDLLKDELSDIIASSQFEAFRKRQNNPETIEECVGCKHLLKCRGGCTARAYLWSKFEGKNASIQNARDPYCLREFGGDTSCPTLSKTKQDTVLVHRDYLCTIIVDPS